MMNTLILTQPYDKIPEHIAEKFAKNLVFALYRSNGWRPHELSQPELDVQIQSLTLSLMYADLGRRPGFMRRLFHGEERALRVDVWYRDDYRSVSALLTPGTVTHGMFWPQPDHVSEEEVL